VCTAISALVAAGLFFSFFLADPANFTPLHVGGKIAFPGLAIPLGIISLGVALGSASVELHAARAYAFIGAALTIQFIPAVVLNGFYDTLHSTSFLRDTLGYLIAPVSFLALWVLKELEKPGDPVRQS
jgi:hypothetical protein